MHYYTISLLALLPLTTCLQTIYLGYVENSAQNAYIAWFSDSSDVCTQGTVFGTRGDFTYCDQDLAIQGHPNITFTGCNPCSPTALPTGVSDGGEAALKCAPAATPAGGFPCAANGGAGVVGVLEYCE